MYNIKTYYSDGRFFGINMNFSSRDAAVGLAGRLVEDKQFRAEGLKRVKVTRTRAGRVKTILEIQTKTMDQEEAI